MMLESESESESKFLGHAGIGFRIRIACYWNRNWNRSHGFSETLESKSESALVESGLESESLVLESFTTLTDRHNNLSRHVNWQASATIGQLNYRNKWDRWILDVTLNVRTIVSRAYIFWKIWLPSSTQDLGVLGKAGENHDWCRLPNSLWSLYYTSLLYCDSFLIVRSKGAFSWLVGSGSFEVTFIFWYPVKYVSMVPALLF